MADGNTANYNWVKPEVGASAATWGAKLNADLDDIDADLKAVEEGADLPGFIANRNGTPQGSLNAGTATGNKIRFDNVVRNDGSHYDGVTNFRFTPPEGVYRVTLSVATSTGTGNESHAAQIWKNGALEAESNYFASGMFAGPGNPRLEVTKDIEFNGADYVEAFVYLPTGTTAISGINNITFFSAYRVRGA